MMTDAQMRVFLALLIEVIREIAESRTSLDTLDKLDDLEDIIYRWEREDEKDIEE